MRVYVDADEIKLVYSGKNYFEVLTALIASSRETLHLQTYIFSMDETGFMVMDALKKAAARGVRVFMMVDAYASFPFPREVAEDLRNSGVHFRLFSPLFSSESIFIGRRLHHKIAVADRKTGLIGGINIDNKYNLNVDENAWLDYAVLIRGEVCEYLHLLCEQFYQKRKMNRALAYWERGLPSGRLSQRQSIRFRRNDWIRGRNEIHKSYIEAILKAETSVTLVASYFLPGNNLRRLLQQAAARGVTVNVIMAGRSDINSLRMAEQYLYDFYLRHGIRVYEWTDSVMHGKAMIVDRKWATIGSYNLNFLSHYVSIELNADIIDPAFVGSFSAHLEELITRSGTLVDVTRTRQKSNVLQRFVMWLAYSFYRLLMEVALQGKKYRQKLRNEG